MKGLSFGLFDLLLLIGVAAVVIGYNSANVRRQMKMEEIHEMKIAAGELIVEDKRKLQAKTNESDFGNVTRRDFYVPKGRRYELRVAHSEDAPKVIDSVTLAAGTHWIDVMYRQDNDGLMRYVIKLDGRDFHEKKSKVPWADLSKQFSYDQELGDEMKIVLLQESELVLWVEQTNLKSD